MNQDEYTFDTRFQMETDAAVFSVALGTSERTKGFVRVSITDLDEAGNPFESISFVLDEGEFMQFQSGVRGAL